MNLFGLDLFSLIVTFISVFVAGIIRGYSGFGFAMVAVTSISLVLPPVQVVPLVLILEVLASIRLVPQVWRDIDWHSLRWLLAGSLFAIPFGVYLLANIPAEPMRMSISLLVLGAATLLLYGWAWRRMPGRPLILTTGMACGLLNGAAAIGGPPVILFYLSSPVGVTASRASIIAYFLGIDVMSLALASIQGLTTFKTLQMTLFCLLPLYFGITVGSRMFLKTDKNSFRHHVLILLILLSIAGLLRGIFI
ncbi:MAG: sulfite exporter TauE/SafE family protein [Desulfobacterales bacterium]|nr:sulfite exporter TauE/SafE family protein [Desulfobacterales bacterium]MDX2513109.1 sulfite exporter TauE/SafE family protein [Desulfobacterales bacterium]